MNVIFVAKPLEAKLEKWMSVSSNIVVVNFGSCIFNLPPSMITRILTAFGHLNKYRFLFHFRVRSKKFEVPKNVRLIDWLPQNDALAHRSTRLFITNSGNNEQLEALYHHVPILCFYFFTDQFDNARRIVDQGEVTNFISINIILLSSVKFLFYHAGSFLLKKNH